MMDEQLIDEVALHGVIYNRQKYYLNGSSSVGGAGAGKYETKDDAWQTIAIKLRTDVETCKKRWKYLRERYVSQRKQGDPPVYEHLSRPYLEKMKFLDQHIQPRKSYRNVPNFLTSPHSGNSSQYNEYNMDSKSNGSIKNMGHFGNSQHHYHQQDQQHAMNALSNAAAAASALESANGAVKIEADQVFRDFAAAVASQQLQQISQSQMHHHQAAAVAAAMAADSSQGFQEQHGFRDGPVGINGNNGNLPNGGSSAVGVPSSSSSMKSPLSSPLAGVTSGHNGLANSTPLQVAAHSSSSANQLPAHNFNDGNNDDLDSSTSSNCNMKKPRVQLNSHVTNITHNSSNNSANNNTIASNPHFVDDTDDDSDDASGNILHPQTILNDHQQDNHYDVAASTSGAAAAAMQRNCNNNQQQQQQNGMFSSNADFLFQLYQQLPHQQQSGGTQQQHFNKFQAPQNPPQRSSEHLLGELVTTELLKMSKERRKNVQKRILEILFFDD